MGGNIPERPFHLKPRSIGRKADIGEKVIVQPGQRAPLVPQTHDGEGQSEECGAAAGQPGDVLREKGGGHEVFHSVL